MDLQSLIRYDPVIADLANAEEVTRKGVLYKSQKPHKYWIFFNATMSYCISRLEVVYSIHNVTWRSACHTGAVPFGSSAAQFHFI